MIGVGLSVISMQLSVFIFVIFAKSFRRKLNRLREIVWGNAYHRQPNSSSYTPFMKKEKYQNR